MTEKNQELWIQISSGQGPEECALAVRKVFENLSKVALNSGLNLEILDSTSGRKPRAYESLLLNLSGIKADEFIRPWLGTVQWVCESPYRPGYKRKNWFVSVRILSAVSVDLVEVNTEDIQWKAVKASGPGGQHVNTTDSAVQALHRPTGIQVTASEARSQHSNKKRAVEKIKAILSAQMQDARDEHVQKQWLLHKELERGNPVKVFVGKEFRER